MSLAAMNQITFVEPDQIFTYHRPQLALSYCDSLQGGVLSDSRSGLFLAAPRRTGKSTFLREDLIPAMENREWTTVYVDLWENKAADPAVLISNAISAALNKYAGVITKLAKSAGIDKVTVMGALSVNLGNIGLPANVTIPDALEALVQSSGHPVALIVDEAQHALSSAEGVTAMFALKAARDRLNQGPRGMQLFLVMTGSHRDKLASLLLNRNQPFYGANLSTFPLLGRDFSDAYVAQVNTHLASPNQFNPDDAWEAFQLVGQRPEQLRALVQDLAIAGAAPGLGRMLRGGAEKLRNSAWSSIESEIEILTPVQRVVLETLLEQGNAFEPFSKESALAYQIGLKKKTVPNATIQTALDALREAGLVWRPQYGKYVVEDEELIRWHQAKKNAASTASRAPGTIPKPG